MKLRIASLAALIVLGFTVNTAGAREPALLSLSMEHFRDSASVTDDRADGTTTITTEKGFAVHTGPMKMVWNDEYLKGVIDRNTGEKSFQVIAMTIYSGNRRLYQTADYQWTDGPKSAPAIQLSTQREGCPLGDCTYTELIAFNVDEDTLRRIAAQYVPGKPTLWSFNITAKPGPGYSGALSSAEFAGFLARVDEAATAAFPGAKSNTAIVKESAAVIKENTAIAQQNAALAKQNAALAKQNAELAQENAALVKGNPALAQASPVSAPPKLEFGIGGIAVAAAAEQPNRAGILVTAVNSGSVAQRAGIIVGDILYEFNGHPISGLAELEAAVAACAAHSSVVIKLYRGTAKAALTARF